MGYNKLGLIAVIALLAVLMASTVFAVESITWVNPNAATDVLTIAAIATEGELNITVGGKVNVSNCSFYVYATDTNETQASPVLIGTNSTGNQTNTTTVNATVWSLKFNATTVQDTANAVFNASCESYNVSVNTPFSTTQSAKTDAVAPTTPTSVNPANNAKLEKSDRTMSFSGTVTAADTTGCYVQFSGRNPGKTIYATNFLGATATNCTVEIANFPEDTFKYQYFATDGINDTTAFSGTREFNVEYFRGASKVGYVQATQQQQATVQQTAKQSNVKTIVIIAAIIIVITQIMKKGKRR